MYKQYAFPDIRNQYGVIAEIVSLLVKKYNPEKIILFGSCARGCIRKNSDIDLCLVLEHDEHLKAKIKLKSEMLKSIYESANFDFSIDIILYTTQKWNELHNNLSTFAGLIHSKGEVVYG